MTWLEDYQQRISYQNTKDFLQDYKDSNTFLITDKNLLNFYHKEITKFNYYSILPGEESKTLEQINIILERLLQLKYSRDVTIIAFGGGIVCDMAGFISAIFKRGCKLALIPTSLIAMVDASIGGKNGVNSQDYKNQFGTIKQADKINIDSTLLASLPQAEVANGMAEVIKHGLLASESYYKKAISFSKIELSDNNKYAFEDLIKESIAIKLSFVAGDEGDKGQRRYLNFGHTLGHAIEKIYQIPHGRAVLWGMLKACQLSYKLGFLPKDLFVKIESDLLKLNTFDTSIINWEKISQALLSDKKREGQGITFILLQDFAKPVIVNLDLDTLKNLLREND